jgi:uncharacterized membrane protein
LLTEDEAVQRSLSTFGGSSVFSIVGLIALKVSAYGPKGRVVLFAVTVLIIALIVTAMLHKIDKRPSRARLWIKFPASKA